MMRLRCLQHVPFEGPANIEVWARERGHAFSRTLLYRGEALPSTDEFDWLIILGGPMGVHDEDRYPWLAPEKRLIEAAIGEGKIVLGVCLGAQLIARVLGAEVYRNRYKEIGWFPVTLTPEAAGSPVFRTLPRSFIAFHWHGDTFDLPPGSIRVAESEGCRNQAFEYNGRVIGLQFHLESSLESIGRLIENCGAEVVEGKYIQRPEEMLSRHGYLEEINRLMNLLLDNIEREFGGSGSRF